MRMNPKVTAYFTAEGARVLHGLQEETGRSFDFTGSEGLPLDHFAVVEEGERAAIEEQSVPFREGEEVHVDIVEPHMYSEDDAVAKVDGYLIEVTDAITYVGREDARADRARRSHDRTRRAGRGGRGGRGRDRRAARRARALRQARSSAPPSRARKPRKPATPSPRPSRR